MTIDIYFQSIIGKKLDYDGVYANQCVDLIKDYADKVLGLIPQAVGDAHEYYTNYYKYKYLSDNFDRIPNTPDFIPRKGDIAVYNTGYGKYGHVCICSGVGNINYFYAYEQNGRGRLDPVTYSKMSYLHLSGVLRPRNQSNITDAGAMSTLPLRVLVNCDCLRVRKEPSTTSPIVTRVYRGEVFGIVAIKRSAYKWGKLKSGAGWIALDYCKEL